MKIGSLFIRGVYYLSVTLALIATLLVGLFFWGVQETFASGLALLIAVIIAVVYFHPKLYNYRFVVPAMTALVVIIVVPVVYVVSLSFTNLSESNKLSYQRAVPYLTAQTFVADDAPEFAVNGWTDQEQAYLFLNADDLWLQTTEPVPLDLAAPTTFELEVTEEIPSDLFDRKFAVGQRALLDQLTLVSPAGDVLTKHKLRSFAPSSPRFTQVSHAQFNDNETGNVVTANFETGQFLVTESEDPEAVGQVLSPGFLKASNLSNFVDILTDLDQIKVIAMVLGWSVFAAAFTVCSSFVIALILASLLNWQALREREWYKFIIVACYALPAFSVINAFFWIFTTDQAPWGELLPGGPVFTVIDQLFGIQLDWQFSPVLSRVKFLIVQFWMFMPFMFILCLGVIQSIPVSLYEAARLEGAGVRQSFRRITLPLAFLPLAPVLIIAFATAFNDLSLVDQLTFGTPEIPGSVPLASHVDLLVSFANRQAFGNAYTRGAGFGLYSLASTLFTLIFVLLALISWLYLRKVRLQPAGREY